MIDATAEANLGSLVKDFNKIGGTVLIAEANETVIRILQTSGLYEEIGSEHFFNDSTDAIDYGLKIINVKKCPICSHSGRTTCKVFQESTTLDK